MNLAQRIYGDNPLMMPLGDLRSRKQVLADLCNLPARPPTDVATWPTHARLHLLPDIRKLYVPPLPAARLVESIDLGLRSHYGSLSPREPTTWARVGGGAPPPALPRVAHAVFVCGQSGSGKTITIQRACRLYPHQVWLHESFPGLVGPHHQVIWQSVSVPATGKLKDLALDLMRTWDDTVSKALGEGFRRFTSTLNKKSHEAKATIDEWKQVASSHFLGILHLDEVQNFFRLPTLAQRRAKRKNGSNADLALSIAEDDCLKYILELANGGAFLLVLSGTPDGVAALSRRFSNAQRFAASGYHMMDLLEADSPISDKFIEQLCAYQYVRTPIEFSPSLAQCIHRHTAGIRRLVIALWICAHREAFERKDDDLRLKDFETAPATYLAPVRQAVDALLSGSPDRLRNYEDLLPKESDFWVAFEPSSLVVPG